MEDDGFFLLIIEKHSTLIPGTWIVNIGNLLECLVPSSALFKPRGSQVPNVPCRPAPTFRFRLAVLASFHDRFISRA